MNVIQQMVRSAVDSEWGRSIGHQYDEAFKRMAYDCGGPPPGKIRCKKPGCSWPACQHTVSK